MQSSTTYLQAAAIALGSIFLIAFANHQLSRKHGSDIRVIWYFFALATTLSFILAHWASSYGAIDSKGTFQGASGEVLSFLLTASLDLHSSIVFCFVVVAILLVPQFISYVLSGLAGCASSPILVGSSIWIVAWGLIKSLAVASGVSLVIPLYAHLNQWSGSTDQQAFGMALLSLMLLSLAFTAVFIYRGLVHVPPFLLRLSPAPLREATSSAKRWLTRNEHQGTE